MVDKGIMTSCFLCVFSFSPGEMGPIVASTLKLGIAILNGGNSIVQQVLQYSLTLVCVMKRVIVSVCLCLHCIFKGVCLFVHGDNFDLVHFVSMYLDSDNDKTQTE